ncbi:MAG: hypothetical protein WCQ91_01805 [Planctomycetota bacterium]
MSRLPVPVEAEDAVNLSQTLGCEDIADSSAEPSTMGVAPHVPGSFQVAMVVNDVGATPIPYCRAHAVDRPWTESIRRSIEHDRSSASRESKLRQKAAPGSPKSLANRTPNAR